MLRYGFFDSEIVGYDEEGMPKFDRAESSDFLAMFISQIISDGVLAAPGDCFQVVASEGMMLKVRPGFGIVRGRFAADTKEAEIEIPKAPTAYKRIDRVVLRVNYLQRLCEIVVKTGTPDATPVPPELLQPASGDFYELCLATVSVNSNQTVIAQAHITDTRYDSSVCGVVTQLIDHLDTSVFFAQLNSFYEEYVARFDGDYADFILKMDSAYQKFYTSLNDPFTGYVDKYNTDYADFTDKMLTAYSQYMQDLNAYFTSLQNKGYSDMADIIQRMSQFETDSEAAFDAWFESVKGKMDGDIGTKAILMLNEQANKLNELEEMLVSGEIHAPLATEDGDILLTESDDVIEAFWYYATK